MKYNLKNHHQNKPMLGKSNFISGLKNKSFFRKRSVGFPFVLLTLFLIFTGCASEVREKFEATKYAFGRANRLCVVADKDVWESNIGDTIRYYFGSAYPILPQPEPFFDITYFTPKELEADPYRKELRSYLLIGDLTDENSPSGRMISKDIGSEKTRKAIEQNDYNITVGRDKWAQGQLLIYLFAQNRDQLVDVIKRNFPAITKRLNKGNADQYEASIYFGGENIALKEKAEAKFGIEIRVPSDYFLAIENEETMWLRKETDRVSSNIMIHKLKYEDQSQLTKEGIKAIRDELGKKYVSTEIDGTYMQINDVDLPMLTQAITINGNYTIEARGIWEIVNDFMGGPFVGYLIHNAATNELLYVDCFVHAPGKKKRDHVQYLEYIVSTLKFSKVTK